MSFKRALVWALCVGLSAASAGCAEFNITGVGRATLTYTEDARAAYFEALAAFKARNFEDARVLFGEVRKLFAYSRYARLAELRLADIDFEQSKYSDAVASYRDFVQNHRSDREVEYARYRISKSLFNDIEDTFILPPAEERDQATTTEAFRDLSNFLSDFPQSRYLPDVKYMYAVVLQRLVRHELYVARYYLREEAFGATVSRIDYALNRYPRSGLDAEALVLKGETLLKMKKPGAARAVFEKVLREFDSPFAAAAKNFLAEMGPPRPGEDVPPPASSPPGVPPPAEPPPSNPPIPERP